MLAECGSLHYRDHFAQFYIARAGGMRAWTGTGILCRYLSLWQIFDLVGGIFGFLIFHGALSNSADEMVISHPKRRTSKFPPTKSIIRVPVRSCMYKMAYESDTTVLGNLTPPPGHFPIGKCPGPYIPPTPQRTGARRRATDCGAFLFAEVALNTKTLNW
jgi:hypothetical protein